MKTLLEYIEDKQFDVPTYSWLESLWFAYKDEKTQILITSNLLYFLGFISTISESDVPIDTGCDKLNSYINFLEENKIEFEKIDAKHKKALAHEILQSHIKQTTHGLSEWILLNYNNFMKSAMVLDNKKTGFTLIEYQDIFKNYLNYQNDYELQQKLKANEQELTKLKEEIQNQKRYSLRLREKAIDTNQLKKEQIIYVSTSKNYANQDRYKVGGVERYELLYGRLKTYNGRSASGDEWYYTKIVAVNKYTQIETRIASILSKFKDKKRKEIYIIHYKDLEKIIDYVIENYNKEVDVFNEILKDMHVKKSPYVPLSVTISCEITDKFLDELRNEITVYFKEHEDRNEYLIKRIDIVSAIMSIEKFKCVSKGMLWRNITNVKKSFPKIKLQYFCAKK